MYNKLSIKMAKAILFYLCILSIWIAFVVLPLSDLILKSVEDNMVLHHLGEFLVIFVLGILPVTFVLWRIIRQLVIKPLLQITDITKTLAMGNLEKRIEIYSDDEFAELSENINKMIANMLSSLQSMIVALQKNHQKEIVLAKNIEQLEKSKQETQSVLIELQKEKNKLQESNAKDEAILTSIGDAVVAIDENRNIFLINSVASQITRFTPEEAQGRPYSEVLHFVTEKDERLVNFIEPVYRREPLASVGRLAIINRENQKIPIAETAAAIKDQNGLVQGVVVIFRDITKERQLDKLKDEFVSVASHELRTPMTAVKGMLSMILEGDYGQFSDELKEPLTDIASSTDRLIDLVNDMLDVSRIEAGRVKISLNTFKLSEVVNEIVGLLQPIAKQKNIELKIDNQSTFTVQADLNKVKQILNNLIGNSLKFTDQGSISVSSKIENELVKVYVKDTGMGITEEDQKKLFTKFTQISTQQTGKPPGTGLGLYISKQLCQIMGGDMWIESSVLGKGSVFAFSVPVAGSSLAKEAVDRVASMKTV